MPSTPQNIATPADAAAFYNGFGLAPAPAAPASDPGAYMQSPSTQAQVSNLYKGMYPIAQSASAPPSQNYDPTSQQNFYNSAGISPAQANQIGAPVSAYVDQNGQRIVGSPASAAAAAVAAASDQGIDWSDPMWAAYKSGGDAAAQAELDYEQMAATPNVPTDWSKANQGTTGLFGFAMSPNQPPQPLPTIAPGQLPIMGATAVAASHPIMASAAPIPGVDGYLYQPNPGGGYTQVGKVNPGVSSAQLYHTQAAQILATQPNGDPNGNVGGVTTTGFNVRTGGQGGSPAAGVTNSVGSLAGNGF